MKITRIEIIPLVRELEEAFSGGTYRIVNRYTLVTRVYTDVGIVGEVFGGDGGGLGGERVPYLGATTGEGHRGLEFLELADADASSQRAELTPRRLAACLRGGERRTQLPERRAVAGCDGVEHGGLDPGSARHQDGD
jgi:hypothetical protein